MTIDDALLMAYADGELDPVTAKRVERALADDPALAHRLAEHRALRERIGRAFAPIAEEPVPERLSALLKSNVVVLPPRRPSVTRWWPAGAVAAGLALAIGLAAPWQNSPGSGDHAGGAIGDALDQRLASSDGDPRLLVSFRNREGEYCRVFASQAQDGIACRDSDGWRLVRTMPGSQAAGTDYRQAGSGDATLLSAAQAMMAGEPLDAAGEASARQRGWR
ncbi:anti-sigma factor [uncultured Sphingomonas sp.]|uniref:anti-sigma factor family protein n=1 Tax=uncultured Sphingomonas sp. TaxID=158754 RepID=UPI002637E671|nr:zf-HC2 domain-containing protein [uncultured Sphingomonas sp.]